MAVPEYILKRWGRPTRLIENPVTDTVNTTPTLVLKNNPDRFQWLIINLSSNDVYLGFSSEVSSTRGIRLGPGGGFATMNADEDGEAVCREVWAVASADGSKIYVFVTEARK